HGTDGMDAGRGGTGRARPGGPRGGGRGRGSGRATLLHAVGDATLGEVVGRHLDLDPVAGQDADVVLAHPPGEVRDDLVAVLQLHPEHRVRERFGDRAFEFDDVVFRHSSCLPWVAGAAWPRKKSRPLWHAGGWGCKEPRPWRCAGRQPGAASWRTGRAPKAVVQRPGPPGAAASAATRSRNRARGTVSAPKASRCGLSTWASIQGQPRACSQAASEASAAFEPPEASLNMLSPKNIRPMATP